MTHFHQFVQVIFES